MKTIIDSKQAERLKEACEKHKIMLSRNTLYYENISLPELLDYLMNLDGAKWGISVSKNSYGKNVMIGEIFGSDKGLENKSEEPKEPVDLLFEFFIWTIENSHYKGIE